MVRRRRRRRASLANKKTGKSKPNNGPTTSSDFSIGGVEGTAEVGLGSGSASITVSEGDTNTLELVAEFDLSPIDFDLDYNSQTNELSGEIGLGLPGDLAGITGGLTVDTETGEITAITGGVELAGLEVKVEVGVGKYACRTVSSMTFFGLGYRVVQDNCSEEKDEPEPEPEPETDDDWGESPAELDPDLYPPNTPILAVVRWRYSSFKINREVADYVAREWRTSTHNRKYGQVEITGEDPKDWVYTQTFIDENGQESTGLAHYKSGWFGITPYEKRPAFFRGTYGNFFNYGLFSYYKYKNLSWSFRNKVAYTRAETEVPTPESAPHNTPVWGWERFCTGRYYGEEGYYSYGDCLTFSRHTNEAVWTDVQFYRLDEPTTPPPPSPRRRPRWRPRPTKDNEDNPMSEDCCLATYQLLLAQCNVTGIAEEYRYPRTIEKSNGETYEAQNIIDYLANQENSNLEKLLGEIPEESIFPIEVFVTETPIEEVANAHPHF